MTFAMSEIASRPVQARAAMRISLMVLAVVAGYAAGEALLARSVATPVAAEPVAILASVEDRCRSVEVEIDEGYGVRGHETRRVCGKAF